MVSSDVKIKLMARLGLIKGDMMNKKMGVLAAFGAWALESDNRLRHQNLKPKNEPGYHGRSRKTFKFNRRRGL